MVVSDGETSNANTGFDANPDKSTRKQVQRLVLSRLHQAVAQKSEKHAHYSLYPLLLYIIYPLDFIYYCIQRDRPHALK